jgi:hypothetical protein
MERNNGGKSVPEGPDLENIRGVTYPSPLDQRTEQLYRFT